MNTAGANWMNKCSGWGDVCVGHLNRQNQPLGVVRKWTLSDADLLK